MVTKDVSKLDKPSLYRHCMAKAKATIILIILCTVPFNPILGVAVAQDTSEGIADITLEYSDEKYTAIRDPTMLPPLLPTYRTQNYYSETFGETFVSYNRLYSESGNVIEIGGLTNYALRELSKSFALFQNLSIFSFESNDYLKLSETVDSSGNYSFQMWHYCSTKWIFFDTCFNDANIVLDRYLIVLGSYWEEQDFIFDLKSNTTIFVGNILFVDTDTSGLGYTLFETVNESNDEKELTLLYPNAAPITIDTYSTDISYNLPGMCRSSDYIRFVYYDRGANEEEIYRLINTQNLSSFDYPMSFAEQCLEFEEYVLVDSIPYSMNELYVLRAYGKEKDTSRFVGIECENRLEGNHYLNSFDVNEYTRRFIRCDSQNTADFSYYFDTMTGDLLKTYKNHKPMTSNEDFILFRNDNDDCLLLNSESNTLIPIIELSDFSCSRPFVHENRLFLDGGIAVIKYSSDGRIDLDDGITIEDVSFSETFSNTADAVLESNIFSISLSIFLFLILVKSRRDSNRNINQLRKDLIEEYTSSEYERVAYVQEERTLPTQNLDADLIRAINLFPDWSRAEIQEHFDNGWSVDQLVEWREDEKNK